MLIHQDINIVYANRSAADTHGFAQEDLVGRHILELFPEHEGARIAKFIELQNEGYADYRALRQDGELIWIEGYARNVEWEGAPARQFTFVEVTEMKQAELLNSALTNAMDNLAEAFALYDQEYKLIMYNKAYQELVNPSKDLSLADIHIQDIFRSMISHNLIPEALPDTENWLQIRMAGLRESFGQQKNWDVNRNGRWKLVREQHMPDGSLLILTMDIDDQKRQEEHLSKAQKMEAIGQLTSGVAHDFNNILTAVIGNLDLLHDQLPANSQFQNYMGTALKASTRGAELVDRLLSFSRSQKLVPTLTNVNETAVHMQHLIARALTAEIEITLDLADDLWPVVVDTAQLESTLLNLVFNARDANAQWRRTDQFDGQNIG